MNLMEKITIRLSPRQLQVLTELKELYGCSFSLLIRAILGSWINTNEDLLEAALTKKNKQNENHTGIIELDNLQPGEDN